MPFEIVRNDITQMRVDAIVNTANPRSVIGSGVDAGIHRAAGPELLTAREKIGRIGVGEAAITPGFDLNAKYVIHTVGPVWRGGLLGERKLLRSCYESSLALALENGCESIAFPLISTGNYGFPKNEALRIALNAIRGFLNDHEMMVSLVVFDREAFQLSRQRYREVASFIDENYIREKKQQFAPREYRRVESWLGDFMRFRQTPDGRNEFLSVDSRSIPANPLYNAFKAFFGSIRNLLQCSGAAAEGGCGRNPHPGNHAPHCPGNGL